MLRRAHLIIFCLFKQKFYTVIDRLHCIGDPDCKPDCGPGCKHPDTQGTKPYELTSRVDFEETEHRKPDVEKQREGENDNNVSGFGS